MSSTLIAVADTVFPTLDPAKEVLASLNPDVRVAKEPTVEGILDVARDAKALFVTYGQITGEVIAGLENCRVIGRFGIGVDNIDLEAAAKAGIVVTYAPVYCLDEVSDHAMAMLLSLARKIPYSNSLVNSGRWEMPAVAPLHRLRGRTLGLVGLGNIPQQVVPKAQAFGIEIVAFDPYAPDDTFARLNVARIDFEQLLARSDFISVHAPLTQETERMFNADAFKKMKPTALLINTARGPLVDVDDLAEALDAGELAGAALDVMPVEPPPAGASILGRDNVILTPHTGFYSVEALHDLQTTVAKDVATVLAGGTPAYPITAK